MPFLLGLLALPAAEVFLRVVDGARLFSRPSLTGSPHMDAKRDAFLRRFLPTVGATEGGTLFMGSSVADTNIAPTEFRAGYDAVEGVTSMPAFNGALLGARMEDALFLMKWYHARWPYSRAIFFIEPGVLRGHTIAGLQDRLSNNPVDWWLRDNLYLFRYRDQLRLYTSKERELAIMNDTLVTFDGWKRTNMWREPRTPADQARGIVEELQRLRFTIRPETLDAVAEWCAAQEIEVVWVLVGYQPEAEEQFPAEFGMAASEAVAREVAARHGNRLLDFRPVRFAPTEFWDATHLNARGGIAFSRILGEEIAQWDRDGGLPRERHARPRYVHRDGIEDAEFTVSSGGSTTPSPDASP